MTFEMRAARKELVLMIFTTNWITQSVDGLMTFRFERVMAFTCEGTELEEQGT